MSPHAGELLVQEIAPRIRSALPSLAAIGSEDAEEQAQDAIATAAALLVSTETRGKKVTPGNIAYYAIALVRQGRRSTGQSQTDLMHPAAQIRGRCRMLSLDAPFGSEADDGELMCLHEVLACRTEDPSMAAARRVDWERLVAALDATAREVLNCLREGRDLTSLVPKLNRSRSALQTDKHRLAGLVREQLGPDILLRIQEQPRWRDNLEANRQTAACRYERQPA